MKNCTFCGHENNKDAKFCLECGNQFVVLKNNKIKFCTECGNGLREGALFCGNCGSAVKMVQGLNNKNIVHDNTVKSLDSDIEQKQYNINNNANSNMRVKSTQINIKKVKKKLKASMFVAGFLVITILTTSILFNAEKLINVFKSDRTIEPMEWAFDGDLNEELAGMPATIESSQTRPVDIITEEGFGVVAQENVLDKDRDFEIEKINHDEISDIVEKGLFNDLFAIDAFKMDAGLGKNEVFPGKVQVSFDLTKYDLVKEAYDKLRIIRYDEHGAGEILSGYVDEDRYVAYTNANSFFVLSCTVVTLLGIRVMESSRRLQEAFGTQRKILRHNLKEDSTYTLYWPDNLGIGNPNAVIQMVGEKIHIYQELGFLDEDFSPTLTGDDVTAQLLNLQKQFREHFIEYNLNDPVGINDISNYNIHMGILNKIHSTDLYKEHSKRYDYKWKKENVWPVQVNYARKQLLEASKYLFEHRGLKKPRSADILITDKNIGALGYVSNPLTMRPYMILRTISQNAIENPNASNNKRVLDEFLITITHELLHLAQSGRYRALMYDFNTNTWFWEATAILLEHEAKDYYETIGLISSGHQLDNHQYYESYLRPPGLLSYIRDIREDPDALIQSGYMGGYILVFLRDRYYKANSGERAKDRFLPNLLEDFSRTRIGDALYVIIRQTSNNQEMARKDFKDFYEKKVNEIESSVRDIQQYRAGNSSLEGWVEDAISLDENKPIEKIIPTRRPFSSMMRVLNLDYDRQKYKDDGAKFVFIRSEEERQANEKLPIYIALEEGRFERVKHERFKVFDNISAHDSIAIQEIHAYSDGWFNFQKPYLAFLMLRPEMPTLEIEENRSGSRLWLTTEKELVIRMPERSALFNKRLRSASGVLDRIGWSDENTIVNKWRITITDPLGRTSVITTNEDIYRVPISGMDGSIDFSDPTIRGGVRDAIGGVLQGDSSLMQSVQNVFGGDLEALIDAIDMGEDLNDLIDAAQILETGGTGDTYKVSVCEVLNVDEDVFGPESEIAKLEHRSEVEEVDLKGVWEGNIMFTDKTLRITIKEGEQGHQYIMVMNSFDDGLAYLNYVGNGKIQITAMDITEGVDIDKVIIGIPFDGVNMTLNDEDRIRMLVPPVTLRRQ